MPPAGRSGRDLALRADVGDRPCPAGDQRSRDPRHGGRCLQPESALPCQPEEAFRVGSETDGGVLVGREGPEAGPTAVDLLDLDDGPLFHPERGERDFIFVGLGVAWLARHLVHRRSEQAAALGREIELVADGLGERQAVELRAGRRVEGDDGPTLRLEALAAAHRRARDMSAQLPAALTMIGAEKPLPLFGRDASTCRLPFYCSDALAGRQRTAALFELPQIALEQRMRVEPDAVAVGNAVHASSLEQRTKLMHAGRVEPLGLANCASRLPARRVPSRSSSRA